MTCLPFTRRELRASHILAVRQSRGGELSGSHVGKSSADHWWGPGVRAVRETRAVRGPPVTRRELPANGGETASRAGWAVLVTRGRAVRQPRKEAVHQSSQGDRSPVKRGLSASHAPCPPVARGEPSASHAEEVVRRSHRVSCLPLTRDSCPPVTLGELSASLAGCAVRQSHGATSRVCLPVTRGRCPPVTRGVVPASHARRVVRQPNGGGCPTVTRGLSASLAEELSASHAGCLPVTRGELSANHAVKSVRPSRGVSCPPVTRESVPPVTRCEVPASHAG